MTYIEGKVRSVWKRVFSAGVIFLGFLGTFALISPRVTTHSSLPALSEANIAYADIPSAPVNYNLGGDDDDDDCGDSGGGDSGGDDG